MSKKEKKAEEVKERQIETQWSIGGIAKVNILIDKRHFSTEFPSDAREVDLLMYCEALKQIILGRLKEKEQQQEKEIEPEIVED